MSRRSVLWTLFTTVVAIGSLQPPTPAAAEPARVACTLSAERITFLPGERIPIRITLTNQWQKMLTVSTPTIPDNFSVRFVIQRPDGSIQDRARGGGGGGKAVTLQAGKSLRRKMNLNHSNYYKFFAVGEYRVEAVCFYQHHIVVEKDGRKIGHSEQREIRSNPIQIEIVEPNGEVKEELTRTSVRSDGSDGITTIWRLFSHHWGEGTEQLYIRTSSVRDRGSGTLQVSPLVFYGPFPLAADGHLSFAPDDRGYGSMNILIPSDGKADEYEWLELRRAGGRKRIGRYKLGEPGAEPPQLIEEDGTIYIMGNLIRLDEDAPTPQKPKQPPKAQPTAPTAPATATPTDNKTLWPIWLGAGVLCALVAGGTLYLRRKRAA